MDSKTASDLISAIFTGYGPDLENDVFDSDIASDNVIALVEDLMEKAWDLGRAEGVLSYRPVNPYRKEPNEHPAPE